MEQDKTINCSNYIDLTINQDMTQAYVSLLMPMEEESISIKEGITSVLDKNNIVFGINESAIDSLSSNPVYNKAVLVAQGQAKEDGTDGYFEFLFDTTTNRKPVVLEDGSVDYSAMMKVVTVAQGDRIAIYHKAVHGVHGMDIKGREIQAYIGKDKSPLKGKGFEKSEDQCTYTALITGKIELNDDRIIISNVLEIKENIDYLQGDIHFKGDLMIYGDVASGMVVEADGAITIRGNVEGATIISGKDVTLESGMQGREIGTIISKGSIRGRFFEYVKMKAGAGVYANALLNCEVEAGTEVVISGKKGIILGGIINAIERVEAANIGNEKEVKTIVNVGVPDSMSHNVAVINKQLDLLNQRLSQIEAATTMIDERSVIGHKNPFEQQKLQLMRTKINTDVQVSGLLAQRYEYTDKITRSRNALCSVSQGVFPGVEVTIQGCYLAVSNSFWDVNIRRRGTEALIESK